MNQQVWRHRGAQVHDAHLCQPAWWIWSTAAHIEVGALLDVMPALAGGINPHQGFGKGRSRPFEHNQ